MLHIECSGSPYEIGFKHGTEARAAIARTIAFYTDKFQESAKLDWTQVEAHARRFEPVIEEKWPAYLEEMRGIATGANQPLLSILAINVRTEIAFGLFSDGCTSLSWLTSPSSPPSSSSSSSPQSKSFLAQNWDWEAAQSPNLVHLSISSPTNSHPHIHTLTEAGLLAKIGLNAAGVGVCLNAIRAKGLDPSRLPCHLALRRVLEFPSREAAVAELKRCGVASACHFLVADATTGGIGLEWSAKGLRELGLVEGKWVFHSNHYLREPVEKGIEHVGWLPDSPFRVSRMEALVRELEARKEEEEESGKEEKGTGPRMEEVQALFRDEENCPGSICRAPNGTSTVTTLFNIVMDLSVPRAEVVVGRPVAPEESFALTF